MKVCRDCKLEKSLDNYYKHNGKPNGSPYCKACVKIRNDIIRRRNVEKHNAYHREWTEKNKQLRFTHQRRSKLKLKYGLSFTDVQALFDLQQGLCGVCKLPLDLKYNVDHDHVTGKVRGLLHKNCNIGLGIFKESVEALQGAINYLSKWKS